MKNENRNGLQFELGLGKARGCHPAKRRLRRANWWFERMRQVVDKAVDWQPVPPLRSEVMSFQQPGLGQSLAKSGEEQQRAE